MFPAGLASAESLFLLLEEFTTIPCAYETVDSAVPCLTLMVVFVWKGYIRKRCSESHLGLGKGGKGKAGNQKGKYQGKHCGGNLCLIPQRNAGISAGPISTLS